MYMCMHNSLAKDSMAIGNRLGSVLLRTRINLFCLVVHVWAVLRSISVISIYRQIVAGNSYIRLSMLYMIRVLSHKALDDLSNNVKGRDVIS